MADPTPIGVFRGLGKAHAAKGEEETALVWYERAFERAKSTNEIEVGAFIFLLASCFLPLPPPHNPHTLFLPRF